MNKTEVAFPSAYILKESYKKKLKQDGNTQRLRLMLDKNVNSQATLIS